MQTFHERKKQRTEDYFRYQYKQKLVTCGACNGTGKQRKRVE